VVGKSRNSVTAHGKGNTMVNERTRELVEVCMNAVFPNAAVASVENINVKLEEKDECVFVTNGEQSFEIRKRYEDVERRTLKGPITVKMAKYDVVRFQYDPGVWRHADGSGTPPSWDETDDGTFDKLDSAIKWIIGCIVDQVVDDAMFCDEMAHDLADAGYESWESEVE